MTQDHSSKLSFSIEESVWLNKGQEVAEIVSLSLDPEITVQEHGEYVLIRGGLKLTGEYRSSGNSNVSDEDNESLSSQVAFRSIEEVTLNEDGTGEIRHHFPIDVTIPQERIRSLDDIYVIVDSFDYDLPERGCIQLTADVSITGMSTGKVNRDITEAEVEAEQEDRTFHYEAYNEERFEDDTIVEFPTAPALEEEEEVEVEFEEEVESVVEEGLEEERFEEGQEVAEHRVELASRSEESEEVAEISEEVEAIAEEMEDVLEVEVEVKEVKSPAIAFGVVKERPKTETAVEQPQATKEVFSVAKSFTVERKQKQQQDTPRSEVEVSEIEETQEDDVKKPREENALYLTKMLTKGEDEQFKKLKLCIIRENETLETIAARYEINQSTLIRVNRLNDANVSEGQILYIPVTK